MGIRGVGLGKAMKLMQRHRGRHQVRWKLLLLLLLSHVRWALHLSDRPLLKGKGIGIPPHAVAKAWVLPLSLSAHVQIPRVRS